MIQDHFLLFLAKPFEAYGKLLLGQDGKGQFEQRLQEAEAKCESVEKEMVDMRQLVQSLQRERDAVDAQARADKKVLPHIGTPVHTRSVWVCYRSWVKIDQILVQR